MWGMPLSTFLAFVALVLTVLASIIWAVLSGRGEKQDDTDGEA
jgi:ABC-type dipeptide/oligopeptide/nickel transport system permease subunit